MPDPSLRIAIVVRVVDNFGDAGIAWRLARQLRREHGAKVVLWIDAPAVLARFVPALAPAADDAIADGVRVRRLPARDAPEVPPLAPWPQLLVQAFGSPLPEHWLDAIEQAAAAPVWVHLEYLSAEDWVDGAHGLPSPHPTRRLTRWFFYPGFTPRTGGLLRERTLPALLARDRALAFADVALPPPPADALAVSLFCYGNPALAALLRAWADGPRHVHALVPDGVAAEAWLAFTGAPARAGQVHAEGALTLACVPFVDQDAFDRRLAACDFAIVRGEDSFVRAQWARRPFAWHIYPQRDDAHRVKLEAFLARYTSGLAPAAATALSAFTLAFNDTAPAATAAAWPPLLAALPALEAHADRWARTLAGMPDLATQLVEFARSRL